VIGYTVILGKLEQYACQVLKEKENNFMMCIMPLLIK